MSDICSHVMITCCIVQPTLHLIYCNNTGRQGGRDGFPGNDIHSYTYIIKTVKMDSRSLTINGCRQHICQTWKGEEKTSTVFFLMSASSLSPSLHSYFFHFQIVFFSMSKVPVLQHDQPILHGKKYLFICPCQRNWEHAHCIFQWTFEFSEGLSSSAFLNSLFHQHLMFYFYPQVGHCIIMKAILRFQPDCLQVGNTGICSSCLRHVEK